MKQGDYVKWIYGPVNERIVSKGTLLRKLPDGRWAVYFWNWSSASKIQFIKESFLCLA